MLFNKIYMNSIQLPGYANLTAIKLIVWLEGEANYTRVHYQDGTTTLVTKSLNHFEQYGHFVRVHRSIMVNSVYVHEFTSNKGRSGLLRLSTGTRVPVSRTHLPMVGSLFGVKQ
ncbi:MAG: LytTR family transcriptional regulator [Pedobacter sp.]|nr:MAG: LytTR family transcriptional regulator [Pedobacter sp.]